MEYFQSLPHDSRVTNQKTFIKKHLAVCAKALTRKRKRRKKRMTVAKPFAVHASTIIDKNSDPLKHHKQQISESLIVNHNISEITLNEETSSIYSV